MDWAVPGSGGGALTTGAPPPEPPEPLEPSEVVGADATGCAATLGVPTTVMVLAAASSWIMCWRACTSALPAVPTGRSAAAAATGSLPGLWPRRTAYAPPVMARMAAIDVIMNTPTRRRERLSGARLRCSDNAVLPSTGGADGRGARRAGLLRCQDSKS